jgi:hypothetical protein
MTVRRTFSRRRVGRKQEEMCETRTRRSARGGGWDERGVEARTGRTLPEPHLVSHDPSFSRLNVSNLRIRVSGRESQLVDTRVEICFQRQSSSGGVEAERDEDGLHGEVRREGVRNGGETTALHAGKVEDVL